MESDAGCDRAKRAICARRYWLDIALGRDPVQADGTPCVGNYTGCQVDVLGTQLEEVIE